MCCVAVKGLPKKKHTQHANAHTATSAAPAPSSLWSHLCCSTTCVVVILWFTVRGCFKAVQMLVASGRRRVDLGGTTTTDTNVTSQAHICTATAVAVCKQTASRSCAAAILFIYQHKTCVCVCGCMHNIIYIRVFYIVGVRLATRMLVLLLAVLIPF